ncbi:MAG: hypothetical protein U0L03_03150, partial [Succinivibrionaceae bacterium]|nr:hypothetical protein [Succinivibrionaceae bacterium]
GKFLSYDKEVQSILLTSKLYIYSMLTSISRNVVFHKKNGFNPTRQRVGFMPQFITTPTFKASLASLLLKKKLK